MRVSTGTGGIIAATVLAATMLAGCQGAGGTATVDARHGGRPVAPAGTGPGAAGSASSSPSTTPAPPALTVASVTPAANVPRLAPDSQLVVRFSQPLTTGSVHPVLKPGVPGTWSRGDDRTLVFTPSRAYEPYVGVTLTVPAGSATSAAGATLTAATSVTWRGPEPSLLRLQQVLARLDYLPLTVSPAPEPGSEAEELRLAYSPVDASFDWRYEGTPAELKALWAPGKMTVLTQGAVMAFEHATGLQADGEAGPAVWHALMAADLADRADPQPYTWVHANLDLPQRLTVWQAGAAVFSAPVNSGIAGARTPLGSWPVYARYQKKTMSGTNPDGTKYVDPDVPWDSFFYRGDAVHGFPRAHYGYPQSVGCLELPVSAADTVWHLVTYGTIVTTTGDPGTS